MEEKSNPPTKVGREAPAGTGFLLTPVERSA
jgi:hypothetical protein